MKVTDRIFLFCTIDRLQSIERGLSMSDKGSDPKDGELCLSRVKSGETLMEARSGTDVQIVRQI